MSTSPAHHDIAHQCNGARHETFSDDPHHSRIGCDFGIPGARSNGSVGRRARGRASATAVAAPPALPPPVPFDEALLLAANDLFTKAALRGDAPSPTPLAIDPLIDGNTGMQSTATQSMGRRITELVRKDFPRYRIEPFNTATVSKSPLILVGTFTPISLTGKNDGPRDAFRVCLALLDLASGKIISKGFARATTDGIDHAPVAFFNDSPVWSNDPSMLAYIRSCQGTRRVTRSTRPMLIVCSPAHSCRTPSTPITEASSARRLISTSRP